MPLAARALNAFAANSALCGAQSAKLSAQPRSEWQTSDGQSCSLGDCGLKTKRSPIRKSAAQLQRFARERADDQARRIPWQRLFEARNQYIDWQEFYLWVRSILEVEDRIPDWLVEILDSRCPGFLESVGDLTPKAAKDRPLSLRLEDWIDDHIFGFARQEGWFSAITFYAIREPRYQRAEVCWSECVERWKKGQAATVSII